MELGRLIARLEQLDQDAIVPFGFGKGDSYRGYYNDLAFEPAEDVTIGSMLCYAEDALGSTYEGYKGGEYTMNEYTDCYISRYGEASGEGVGETLCNMWEVWSKL